ncbi:hypothetical protein Pan181_13910 [Aeoliella mucimassa]|uniref:Transmembrane protein n=2 Tax=Aeoliella mucimassa TaxID=2527972 RepID=A0A518AKF6_9BACT|nr:hypothetical protein Pan181_13910 [Aeoliella mucimassa]
MQFVSCSVGSLSILLGWGYALFNLAKVQNLEPEPSADATVRLQLGDLFSLFVFVIPPLLVISFFRESTKDLLSELCIGGGMLLLFFIVLWWLCVEALSLQGISSNARRFACLAFLVPASLIGGLLAVQLLVSAPFVMFDANQPWHWWAIISVATGLLGAAIGWGQRRVFRLGKPQVSSDDP